MSRRARAAIVVVVSVLLLGGAAGYGVAAWAARDAADAAPSSADVSAAAVAGARVVFRNTATGAGYGHVAEVALDDPTGPRALRDAVCDRVDASGETVACLRSIRGIVPAYAASVLAADGSEEATWPLPGVPSRTRFSPDGTLVATTAFVTGHSYMTVGFSTETRIHAVDGTDLGNLEEWTLLIDGAPATGSDRNVWGVTFVDDRRFYATVGMSLSGTTWLVAGDLATHTLTALAQNMECPSLSPDGTRIAVKRVTSGSGAEVHWTPAIYDIADGSVTLLPEPRSIDDQIAWLDDRTILYGLPRDGAPGDTDVWRLDAGGAGAPSLFIEHAWSPAIVRDGSDAR